MFSLKKIYNFIIIISIFTITVILTLTLMQQFEHKIERLHLQQFSKETQSAKESIKNLINAKQKSTMAIALSYAQGNLLLKEFLSSNKKSLKNSIDKLSLNLRQNSDYKNVWIQVFDKYGISFARTWTDKSGDLILDARKDLAKIIKNPIPTSSISVGKFTLSFKATVPIYDKKNRLLGFIEAITHFNSLEKELQKIGYDSVVLVDKSYKKQLTNSITKQFIEDYYLVNFAVNPSLLSTIRKTDLETILSSDTFVLKNNQVLSAYHIKDSDGHDMAYYIFIKNAEQFEHKSIGKFIHYTKLTILLIAILFMASIAILYKRKYDTEKQKIHFRRVLDSTMDIIVTTNTHKLLDVNKAFFDYFSDYENLSDFSKNNGCLCDLFMKEEGYLQKYMGDLTWVEYVCSQPEMRHKVKISNNNKISIFHINIQKLHKKSGDIYTVVLTDITKAEEYKEKLEKLSTTDTLTKIGNRYHFMHEINREFDRAKRYKSDLSLVMIDIDHFKAINDNYGHDIGDFALVSLASKLSKLLRKTDTFCRYGGEEFMIILPKCSVDEAKRSAQRFCESVEMLELEPIRHMTISIGVTQLKEKDSIDFMIKRADDAMYASKENGRNRVSVK